MLLINKLPVNYYKFNILKTLPTLISLRHVRRDARDSRVTVIKKSYDYLGICEVTSKDISGIKDEDYGVETNDLSEKYKSLLNKRDAKANEEVLHETSFGKIRFDADNVIKYHGQYDENNDAPMFDIMKLQNQMVKSDDNKSDIKDVSVEVEYAGNVIEEQYFGKYDNEKKNANDTVINDDLNFIDKQYFNSKHEPLYKKKINFKFSDELKKLGQLRDEEPESVPFRKENIREKIILNKFESPLRNDLFPESYKVDYDYLSEYRNNRKESENQNQETENIINPEDFVVKEEEHEEFMRQPKTAYEYIKDIREGKSEPYLGKRFKENLPQYMNESAQQLDSKGFRILKDQIPDFNKFTNEDILQMLKDRILFNDADILILNKPYGFICQGEEETATGPLFSNFLPQLANHVNCEKLYTVHRLDKETTGVYLLAKTQEKARFLNKLFKECKIHKQYWCITRGIPDLREGIIDIPIEAGHIEGRSRMALRPEILEESRRIMQTFKNAKRAVTHYTILAENGNAGLIEARPETGVKHQIRVHLGFGLRCPILGDHKYSHLNKLVPQTLPNDMLLLLRVRQSKVRYIPLHLHSRQCLIPQSGYGGRDITVHAPLPVHFVKNMASLKLRY